MSELFANYLPNNNHLPSFCVILKHFDYFLSDV